MRQLKTVDDRHAQVQQRHIRHARLGARHGVIGAVGDTNIMSEQGQELGERVGDIRNIINDEDVCHSLGQLMRVTPPFFTRVQILAMSPSLTFL